MIGLEIAAIILAIFCGLAMVIVATGWTVGRTPKDEGRE